MGSGVEGQTGGREDVDVIGAVGVRVEPRRGRVVGAGIGWWVRPLVQGWVGSFLGWWVVLFGVFV